jgi:hypothetical protein
MDSSIRVPTRKVLVRVFGQQCVFWDGEIVVEVNADVTDKEINKVIRRNASDLPEPEEWRESDEGGDIEVAVDGPHVVVGDADPDRKADVRLFVKA